MQFRTQIPIKKSSFPISYDSRIVSLGSCFAVNMGAKLDYFKFRNTTNPFGILFHPLALEKAIQYSLSGRQFTEDDVFHYNERWHCYDAHSDLSSTDADELIESLNSAAKLLSTELKRATHIIITMGTAWAYRHIEADAVVANCHKVPQKEFTKELLTVPAIKKSLQNIIELVHQVNNEVQVIFTISPVRHIKDGFAENQHSKANLISSLHEILNDYPDGKKLQYFPSYEIMMDELRDYRFYAEDMIHPSQTAVDYIWEKFTEGIVTEQTSLIMNEVDSIQKGLLHRPFNADSSQHTLFLNKLTSKINRLQEQYPHIVF